MSTRERSEIAAYLQQLTMESNGKQVTLDGWKRPQKKPRS